MVNIKKDNHMSVENKGNALALNHLLALEQATQMKNSDTYRTLIKAIGRAGRII